MHINGFQSHEFQTGRHFVDRSKNVNKCISKHNYPTKHKCLTIKAY